MTTYSLISLSEVDTASIGLNGGCVRMSGTPNLALHWDADKQGRAVEKRRVPAAALCFNSEPNAQRAAKAIAHAASLCGAQGNKQPF